MATIPSPDWTHIGSTGNAEVYEMRSDVIVIVPHPDSRDDGETARQSLDFQRSHWTKLGHPGAVIVYMDPVIEQTMEARSVYANETGDVPTTCYALVGESFFAQMSAAVFEGLAKPRIETRIFSGVEEALGWIGEMNKARGSSR